jgi:hypothetical protein
MDRAGRCGDHLTSGPQPASRTLMFVNLLMDSGIADIRKSCGVPEVLAQWFSVPQDGPQATTRRSVGGFFSTEVYRWFLDGTPGSFTETCKTRMYSLTTSAKRPGQLQRPSYPQLQRIIQESINIVDSIEYKRCAPRPSSLFKKARVVAQVPARVTARSTVLSDAVKRERFRLPRHTASLPERSRVG